MFKLHARRQVPALAALVVAATCLAPAFAAAADFGPTRNHITLGFGIGRHVSDDFEDSGLETGTMAQLGYRYTLNQNFDLCFDARTLQSGDTQMIDDGFGGTYEANFEHDTNWYGPGVRWMAAGGSVRPFMQANLMYVTETVRMEIDGDGADASETGVGFGLMGGIDIPVTSTLSIPVEANYMYAKPENDVSSFGMQAGLTFNFSPF
jgi:opacity protein-like surface antigen